MNTIQQEKTEITEVWNFGFLCSLRLLLFTFLLLQPACTSTAQVRSVSVNTNGLLLAPTNFFVANSNLLNQAVAPSGASSGIKSNSFTTNNLGSDLEWNPSGGVPSGGLLSIEGGISITTFGDEQSALTPDGDGYFRNLFLNSVQANQLRVGGRDVTVDYVNGTNYSALNFQDSPTVTFLVTGSNLTATATGSGGLPISVNGTNLLLSLNLQDSTNYIWGFDGTSNVTLRITLVQSNTWYSLLNVTQLYTYEFYSSNVYVTNLYASNVYITNLTILTNGTVTFSNLPAPSVLVLSTNFQVTNAVLSGLTLGDDNTLTVTGGGVSGSGTANKVTKWTSSSAIGNASFTDDGTRVTFPAGVLSSVRFPDGSLAEPSIAFGAQTNVGLARLVDTTLSVIAGGSRIADFANGTFGTYDGLTLGHIRATNDITLLTGPGAGKVLTSDAFGVGSWQTPASGSVSVNGTNVTTPNLTNSATVTFGVSGSNITATAATSGVTGSGTINTLAKWISGSAIGNSVITDDGSNATLSGKLLFSPDNTLDIGATNATRARTLFLGTSLDTPKISTSGNLDFYTTGLTAATHRFGNGQIVVVGAAGEYAAGSTVGAPDVKLLRDAAATWQMGSDSATPIAQTFKGADARAGTDSNTAGGNITIAAGRNTGTGNGGSLILATALPTTSGTGAGTLAARLTIDGVTGVGNFAATPTVNSVSVLTNALGIYRDQSIEAGAMYVGNLASPATTGTYTNTQNDTLSDSWTFADAATNTVRFSLTLPDAWNLSTVKLKLYVTCDGTNSATITNLVWGVSAGSLGPTEALTNAIFGTEVYVTNGLATAGHVMQTFTTPAITVGGSPALGDSVWFQIAREGGNASDTWTNTSVRLLKARVQWLEATTPIVSW